MVAATQAKGTTKINTKPPLVIRGGALKPINYKLKVASAQVKSCILLAGLYADGTTRVSGKIKSRDHTERILKSFKAKIHSGKSNISIKGNHQLKACNIAIPSDISSAAFFMIAATIVPNSSLVIKSVGVNPARFGILKALKKMGAKVKLTNKKTGAEPTADICIKSSSLKATTIGKDLLPSIIDELPILMVAATQAKGTTKIKDAKELRVKETDRISSMCTGLKKMGADIKTKGNSIFIKGPTKLKGAEVSSLGDHRTAMSLAIAGLCAEGKTVIKNTECIATSFPDFKRILHHCLQ